MHQKYLIKYINEVSQWRLFIWLSWIKIVINLQKFDNMHLYLYIRPFDMLYHLRTKMQNETHIDFVYRTKIVWSHSDAIAYTENAPIRQQTIGGVEPPTIPPAHVMKNNCLKCEEFNTWRPRRVAAIWKKIFSKAFSWMKICELRFKFHWNLFIRLELTIFWHWFR